MERRLDKPEMNPKTVTLSLLQTWKSLYVISLAPFFKLLLVDVPNAGPWKCVFLNNACVIGPYSPQWFGFYQLFSRLGYWPEMGMFCLIDSLIILSLGRFESLAWSIPASLGGFFFLFYDPGDLLIYWMALLSRGHWFLSLTAIFTKLPIGAPLSVWNYIWTISVPQDSHTIININSLRIIILFLAVGQPLWRKLAKSL